MTRVALHLLLILVVANMSFAQSKTAQESLEEERGNRGDAGETQPMRVVSVSTQSFNSLDCFRIETPTATYFLDKVGAGLAGMIDREGKDWLSFDPEEGTGASGEYRGFPNAVFKEAGNYFHAQNAGTDACVTKVERQEPDELVISAKSDNGKWAARYTFTPTECIFTISLIN